MRKHGLRYKQALHRYLRRCGRTEPPRLRHLFEILERERKCHEKKEKSISAQASY